MFTFQPTASCMPDVSETDDEGYRSVQICYSYDPNIGIPIAFATETDRGYAMLPCS